VNTFIDRSSRVGAIVSRPSAPGALPQEHELALREPMTAVSGKFRQTAIVKRRDLAIHRHQFRRSANRSLDSRRYFLAINRWRCCSGNARRQDACTNKDACTKQKAKHKTHVGFHRHLIVTPTFAKLMTRGHALAFVCLDQISKTGVRKIGGGEESTPYANFTTPPPRSSWMKMTLKFAQAGRPFTTPSPGSALDSYFRIINCSSRLRSGELKSV
jgi:hypothetical protein